MTVTRGSAPKTATCTAALYRRARKARLDLWIIFRTLIRRKGRH